LRGRHQLASPLIRCFSSRLAMAPRTCATPASAAVSQPARHCGRHQPRSVRARGSARVSCRDQLGRVAILDRGGMNDDTHRQPFAVDQHVDFTSLDLLAGVVTHLVVFAAPFSPGSGETGVSPRISTTSRKLWPPSLPLLPSSRPSGGSPGSRS
jgi:hypothetical protein